MVNYNKEDLQDHQAVAAIIKDNNGNILMQEHVKYGFWTIPIGKANKNQDLKQATIQEIREECNIIPLKFKEIALKEYNYIRNGINVKVILHIFEIINYSGKIKNNEPEKHKQQKFLSLEEIKKLPYLSDSTILYLETLSYKRKARI